MLQEDMRDRLEISIDLFPARARATFPPGSTSSCRTTLGRADQDSSPTPLEHGACLPRWSIHTGKRRGIGRKAKKQKPTSTQRTRVHSPGRVTNSSSCLPLLLLCGHDDCLCFFLTSLSLSLSLYYQISKHRMFSFSFFLYVFS